MTSHICYEPLDSVQTQSEGQLATLDSVHDLNIKAHAEGGYRWLWSPCRIPPLTNCNGFKEDKILKIFGIDPFSSLVSICEIMQFFLFSCCAHLAIVERNFIGLSSSRQIKKSQDFYPFQRLPQPPSEVCEQWKLVQQVGNLLTSTYIHLSFWDSRNNVKFVKGLCFLETSTFWRCMTISKKYWNN